MMEFLKALEADDPILKRGHAIYDNEKRIIDEIIKRRNEKGLTQTQLAKASGLSTRTIQKIERWEVAPSIFSLIAIAYALGTEVVLK